MQRYPDKNEFASIVCVKTSVLVNWTVFWMDFAHCYIL